MTSDFAAIAEAARALDECIIDGEIVALDHNGAPDFAALQAALSDGQSKDLAYFAFDVLYAQGQDLRAGHVANVSQSLRLPGLQTTTIPEPSDSRVPGMPASGP
jgi:bifunctional non-homologous end joining protein LigD